MSKRRFEGEHPPLTPRSHPSQQALSQSNPSQQLSTPQTSISATSVAEGNAEAAKLIAKSMARAPEPLERNKDMDKKLKEAIKIITANPNDSEPPDGPESGSDSNQDVDPEDGPKPGRTPSKNLFVTGPAGSGKSWLINHLVEELRQRSMSVEIVAPTGTAALNVGGKTCHSYFGLTPNTAKKPLAYLEDMSRSGAAQQRLRDVQVLIIDEISMVSNEFFRQMDKIMQAARNSKKPFGGAIVCCFGDFAQLAPVKPISHCIICGHERMSSKRTQSYICGVHGTMHITEKWAFRCPTWRRLRFNNILLDNVLRQESPTFQNIIYEMWLGNQLTDQQIRLLNSRNANIAAVSTHLYTLRENAAIHNKREFDRLTGFVGRYKAVDHFQRNEAHNHPWIYRMGEREQGTNLLGYLRDHRYAEKLELRVGMPVILLQNIEVEGSLVNGSQGIVVGFAEGDALDTIPTVGGQIDPLGLSWDDESGHVTDGYYESLGGSHRDVRKQQVLGFILCDANRGQRWPIVEFTDRDGRRFRAPIYADCSCHEIYYAGRTSLIMRTQIPLAPGWAMTIHKAQGLTMDAVRVDLNGSFDPGQEYVALSRARTMQGLQVTGLSNGPEFRTPHEVRRFMADTFPQLRSRMTNFNPQQAAHPITRQRRQTGRARQANQGRQTNPGGPRSSGRRLGP